jgi:hypothetical protein
MEQGKFQWFGRKFSYAEGNLTNDVRYHWQEQSHLVVQSVPALDMPYFMPDKVEKFLFGEEVDCA